jgi:hypothetical protein
MKPFICILVAIFSLPLDAQFTNPLKAAKDAYNKAKAQTQRQTQAQTPGQNPAQKSSPAANVDGPFTVPPGTKIEPTLLAPTEQGAQFAVSPHGIHMGTVSHSGSRFTVIYDGVPGPKFDQIFPQGNSLTGIVFSPDGNRYAYCALQGNEFVVMVDGKEMFRDSHTNVQGRFDTNSCGQLTFTSNSKHVYFSSMSKYEGATAGFRFVFDGKADPMGSNNDYRTYAFSPDGDHVAYVWSGCGRDTTQKLLIDGKPAPYLAGNPQWTADSKHLYTTRSSTPQQWLELLADGKPVFRARSFRLYIPPVGNMDVAVVDKDAGAQIAHFVVIGGKIVPGSECTSPCNPDANVTFSPDGKHYAIKYRNAQGREFVFADGKRGLDYGRLDTFYTYSHKTPKYLGFTADPAKVVYVADDGNGGQFLVTGDQESQQMHMMGEVSISPTGNHVLAASLKQLALDGKFFPIPDISAFSSLIFSPDGAHYAFAAQSTNVTTAYLDGIPQAPAYAAAAAYGATNDSIVHFSPDSKHLAFFCRSASAQGVCLDGKFTPMGAGTLGNLEFSEDSNHLYWNTRIGPKFRAFVDGKPVLESGVPATGGFEKEVWQTDGLNGLIVLAVDDTGFKRFRITSSDSTSLATMSGAGDAVASR